MVPDDFFQEIEHPSLKWGDYQVFIPVFYRDLRFISVTYLASTKKIQSLLPSNKLKPFRVTPWHSAIMLTAYEYKDTDIGPYNELGVGIPVTINKPSPLFTGSLRKPPVITFSYIHHLPVTTEFARVLGYEIAGYPKFIADIEFEDEEDWLICTLKEKDQLILRIASRKLPLINLPRFRNCPITYRNGYLLRSELICSERKGGFSRQKNDVKLELGDHPIAEELSTLNLGKPSSYTYNPQAQFILTPAIESLKG